MRKHRDFLSPDLTPLIDIVFLLLVFFLVSSVLKKEELSLLLNLPKSKYMSKNVLTESINISITEEKIYFNEKNLEIEELDQKLFKIDNKKIAINMRIDEDVKYERMIKIFDLLKKNGMFNLSLISQKED